MPLSYVIHDEENLVVSRADGQIAWGDIAAHWRALSASPEFKPDMDHLFDLTGLACPLPESRDIRKLADQQPIFSPSSRRAIVASSGLVFGLARMFQELRGEEAEGARVFYDMKEARGWLGLAEEATEGEPAVAAMRPPPPPEGK